MQKYELADAMKYFNEAKRYLILATLSLEKADKDSFQRTISETKETIKDLKKVDEEMERFFGI